MVVESRPERLAAIGVQTAKNSLKLDKPARGRGIGPEHEKQLYMHRVESEQKQRVGRARPGWGLLRYRGTASASSKFQQRAAMPRPLAVGERVRTLSAGQEGVLRYLGPIEGAARQRIWAGLVSASDKSSDHEPTAL